MASHTCRKKSSAEAYANRMRKRGFEASVYKKKKGYGVSVTKR